MKKRFGIRGLFLPVLLLLFLLIFSLPAAAENSTVPEGEPQTGITEEDPMDLSGQRGFVQIYGKTYYILDNGFIARGWQTIGGKKYYFFTGSGEMATGWLKSTSGIIRYFKKDGSMAVGAAKIEGKYYYFKASTGALTPGVHVINGARYYYDPDTGYAVEGLTRIGDYYYYIAATGKMKKGLKKVDEDWYYFKEKNYRMAVDEKIQIDGYTYFFGADGKAVKGFYELEGAVRYFDAKGRMVTKNRKIDGINTYISSEGMVLYQGAKINTYADCDLLMDASTGEVLYAKNAEMPHSNASTTKMLTALLVLENCALDEVVTASANAAQTEETKLYMHEGEQFYVKDLLYSLLIPSHNDTAVALAEHVAGSQAAFALLMNKRAAELGCISTFFTTPNGLDAGFTHYTTCYDLEKIAAACMKNPIFQQIVSTSSYGFTSITGYSYSFGTTNSLLYLEDVCGIKTGYTDKAGYCFVGALNGENGHLYITVTLGGHTSADRWTDAQNLMAHARKVSAV